jgi:Ca2+-transporting ATPase
MDAKQWYQMSVENAVQSLQVKLDYGLTSEEVNQRLASHGPNKMIEEKRKPAWQMLLAQFKDFMVLTLLVAAIISGFLGGVTDTITIMAIVALNAILGFIQEYRAEKSIAALKKLSALEARVIRDGREVKIPAEALVPGDLVNLEAGTRIPADLRLLKAVNLEVEEAALTGESVPVRKNIEPLTADQVPLGDRRNMAYVGTSVTRGRGQGVVVSTGMQTELGKVAGMIQQAEEEDTPLQRRLAQMGKILVIGCLLICALVVGVGMWRGENLYHMFMVGVSLAVAAIPEGLPAIVTVVLAVGVQRMIRRRAIVRKLPAVETLGCATVICSDKTGTLTKNEMTVRKLYLDGRVVEVTGDGYAPYGKFQFGNQSLDVKSNPTLQQLLKIGTLCNNARLEPGSSSHNGQLKTFRKLWQKAPAEDAWSIIGDPTEGSLVTLAAKGGLWQRELAKHEQRVAENPFESERKRMSVVYRKGKGQLFCYVKGAPDIILEKCNRIYIRGQIRPLETGERKRIDQLNSQLAAEALRVLALAYRPLAEGESLRPEKVEQDLIFVGLAGMIDPPRPAAIKAVQDARQAGIRSVMITGDHPATALAIAKEMSIAKADSQVLTGPALDRLTDDDLAKRIDEVTVFARVSPAHKVRIVRALKQKGHIVAMTGDGVNDAPAVKEADIGIAMGKTGTDVTKEASAMVLADDNFATIVSAIEEGRSIYDNIRKFIRYLLGCNIGEVLTMFLAPLMGFPLPLLPIQILWVNLVTDGLPALALGVDKGDPDIMERPPRHPRESIFARGLGKGIICRGIEIALGTLLVFLFALYYWGDGSAEALKLAQTTAFCSLVFFQLFFVFQCRSETHSVFELGFLGNPYLILAVAVSTAMQLAVVYVPLLSSVFGTVPLAAEQWLLVLLIPGLRQLISLSSYIGSRTFGRKLMFWKVKIS